MTEKLYNLFLRIGDKLDPVTQAWDTVPVAQSVAGFTLGEDGVLGIEWGECLANPVWDCAEAMTDEQGFYLLNVDRSGIDYTEKDLELWEVDDDGSPVGDSPVEFKPAPVREPRVVCAGYATDWDGSGLGVMTFSTVAERDEALRAELLQDWDRDMDGDPEGKSLDDLADAHFGAQRLYGLELFEHRTS